MLCKELLEWAPTLPDNLKIKGRTTKYLLRKLAEKYLPTELINQPKRGFEIPLKKWVNNELKDIIISYLQSTDSYYPTLIKKSFVKNLIDHRIKMSDEKRAKMLWALFCLEVWYHKCLKRNRNS
jgi:asparagine synthase (glutamine-hydrolysing)